MRRIVLSLTLGLLACDGAERRDAETVVAAVQRFRTADFATTPAAVAELRKTPCAAAEVCTARETCLSAGEATSRAIVLKAEAARGIAALEKGTLPQDSDEARSLPLKLDEAEALFKKGHNALPACDEQVQALKRKHRF